MAIGYFDFNALTTLLIDAPPSSINVSFVPKDIKILVIVVSIVCSLIARNNEIHDQPIPQFALVTPVAPSTPIG